MSRYRPSQKPVRPLLKPEKVISLLHRIEKIQITKENFFNFRPPLLNI